MKFSILTTTELREWAIEQVRQEMPLPDAEEVMSDYTYRAMQRLQELIPNRFLSLVADKGEPYPYFAALDTLTGTIVDVARNDQTGSKNFVHFTPQP